MIYGRDQEVENFSPFAHVVACYVICSNEFLFLQHAADKPELGGLWGLVAGKLNPGEAEAVGMCRELREETRIQADPKFVVQWETLQVRTLRADRSHKDLLYTVFTYVVEHQDIKLSAEHQASVWLPVRKALEDLPLVHDLDLCLIRHRNSILSYFTNPPR